MSKLNEQNQIKDMDRIIKSCILILIWIASLITSILASTTPVEADHHELKKQLEEDRKDHLRKKGYFGIRNRGADKCLDVHKPDSGKNGAKVQLWDCTKSGNQLWKRGNMSGTYVHSSGKCLDAHLPDIRKNGAKVQLWDCTGGSNQKWLWIDTSRPRGQFTKFENQGSGKCLDAHKPDLRNNGAKVQLWDCTRASNQEWEYDSLY